MGRKRKESMEKPLKNGMQPTLKGVAALIPPKDSELYQYVGERADCYTTDAKKYMDLINEQEKYTSRAVVSTSDFDFATLDEKMYEKLIKDTPQDIVDDAISCNLGVVLRKGRQNYIVSETGEDTLWRRVNAKRDMIPDNLKVKLFNCVLGCKNGENGEDVILIAQNGKIAGEMTTVWTPLPANEVIALCEKSVKDYYGDNIVFVDGYFGKTRYEVEYRFVGEEAQNMSALTKEQLIARSQKLGIAFDDTNFEPSFGFVIRTGEIGNDTVSIRAKISNGTGGMLVGNNITIYHKGDKNIADIIGKRFSGLFAAFQDTVNNLIIAADIKILDWRSCIVNLAEHAKINDDIWKRMVVDFAEKHNNPDIVTGFDILSAFMDSSAIYAAINKNASQQMRDMYNVKVDIIMSLASKLSDFDNNEAEVRRVLETQSIRYPELVLEGAAKELKIPVNVLKRLRDDIATKRVLFAITNSGEEMAWKSLDIYEMIANSATYMKNWYVEKKGLSGEALDEKMAAYAKILTRAKDVCYVVYDKETA
jgi:hypothetical protein